MKKEIDSLNELQLDSIDWPDLEIQTHTHRSTSKGQGTLLKPNYRSGLQTRIGDIEESVWAAAVTYLAKAKDEEWLLTALQQWYLNKAAWCKGKPDVALAHAREALCSRLFDEKKWVDYEAFNLKYRPHILEGENTE